MNVVLTAQSGQHPAHAAQPATPSLTRAALEMLAAQAGKTLAGTVLGQAQNGLTELRLGGVTLAVRLSPQLPPGLPVRVTIVPSTQGPPTLSVQPLPTVATVPQTLAAKPSSPPPPSSGVAPAIRAAVPTASVATAPASPPSGPVATARAPAMAPAPPTGGAQPSGQPSAPHAASSPTAAGARQAAPPPVATPAQAPASSGSAAPAGPATPAASVGQAPAGGNGPVAATPRPTAQSPASMPVARSAARVQPAQSASLAPPGMTTAASPPAAAAARSSAPAAPFAAGSSPVLKPATVLAASLGQPTQAAARQDSILPLLQNLAALSLRAAKLPAPVAEAATRLLAQRIPLDRGAPSADALRSAVTRAGVASLPSAGTSNADVKSALLQLRAGLFAMLGDGEVTPVAPVERRPAPPMRAAQPRGVRAEAPTLTEAASGREAARTLLGQTDSALSRLKLTQLASQPTEARPGAAAPALDLTIEIPMMLGHELSLAQLQVQRDGKSKATPGESGWRLRFAVNFSVVGEVGAQVSLLGGATSVMLWAAEDETAAALEEMLPDLGAALAARGLEIGAVRLRRGVPQDAAAPSGQLMDRVR